jgi:hypothetical protein
VIGAHVSRAALYLELRVEEHMSFSSPSERYRIEICQPQLDNSMGLRIELVSNGRRKLVYHSPIDAIIYLTMCHVTWTRFDGLHRATLTLHSLSYTPTYTLRITDMDQRYYNTWSGMFTTPDSAGLKWSGGPHQLDCTCTLTTI